MEQIKDEGEVKNDELGGREEKHFLDSITWTEIYPFFEKRCKCYLVEVGRRTYDEDFTRNNKWLVVE